MIYNSYYDYAIRQFRIEPIPEDELQEIKQCWKQQQLKKQKQEEYKKHIEQEVGTQKFVGGDYKGQTIAEVYQSISGRYWLEDTLEEPEKEQDWWIRIMRPYIAEYLEYRSKNA